jgi:hypothetical protein
MHDDRIGGNTEMQFLSFRLVVSPLSRSAVFAKSNTFASSYRQFEMLDSSGRRPEGVKLRDGVVYRCGKTTLTSTAGHLRIDLSPETDYLNIWRSINIDSQKDRIFDSRVHRRRYPPLSALASA